MIIVSVITPVYNAAAFIDECVRSVLAQTFKEWELILVDDGSEDDSLSIMRRYSIQDSRIKTFSTPVQAGPAKSRNLAIEMAQGRYLAFLDADDIWLPHKLETQIRFMQQRKIVFSFSAYDQIDGNGKHIGHMAVPQSVDYMTLLKGNVIGCLTAIYDVEFFGKIYMPEIWKRQDFGLWLALLKKVDLGYGIQESLALYRVHDQSVSSNKLSSAVYNWKLYREIEGLSVLDSLWFFSHYAARGLWIKLRGRKI